MIEIKKAACMMDLKSIMQAAFCINVTNKSISEPLTKQYYLFNCSLAVASINLMRFS